MKKTPKKETTQKMKTTPSMKNTKIKLWLSWAKLSSNCNWNLLHSRFVAKNLSYYFNCVNWVEQLCSLYHQNLTWNLKWLRYGRKYHSLHQQLLESSWKPANFQTSPKYESSKTEYSDSTSLINRLTPLFFLGVWNFFKGLKGGLPPNFFLRSWHFFKGLKGGFP